MRVHPTMYDGKSITAITKNYLKKHQKDGHDNDDNESGDHTLIIDEDKFFFDETVEKSNEPVDTKSVNDDTYFDYDNLDETEYDFSEEEILKTIGKTIGSQQCHICLKHMKHFNNQYIWDEKIKIPEVLKHGICPLHCKIRSMEWLFGVAVKLRTEEKMTAWMKSASYVDLDNFEENEVHKEEPNKEEIEAMRKIFEKEAKQEIQQEFVDKILKSPPSWRDC